MKDIDINNLPEDIQKLIIYDYVKPDLILLELKEILNSEKSKKLDWQSLYLYLKDVVFKNEIIIKNLNDNDKIFNLIYKQHILKNEKTFELIDDPIESMALSWLMYLYH